MFWLGFADQSPPGVPPAPPAAPPEVPPGEPPHPDDADGAGDVSILLPWTVSVLLHLGIVLLSVFLVWSTQDTTRDDEQEIIIPIARLSETPGAPLTVQRMDTQMQTSANATVSRPIDTLTSPTASTARRIGGSASAAGADTGFTGQLSGAASAGRASPFATGVNPGAGLRVKFFGMGGNARRLVFIVDASGSLIDTLPFVINELKRSIGELSEQQDFTVIFFQGEEPIEVPVPNKGLKRASPETKQKVIEWIDLGTGNIVPRGVSNPVKALRLALQYRPDLIYILSDNITGSGRYEVDQNHLLAAIEEANTQRTKINTIQYIYRDRLEDYGLTPTLQRIAEQSGGTYKFLDAKELGIQ